MDMKEVVVNTVLCEGFEKIFKFLLGIFENFVILWFLEERLKVVNMYLLCNFGICDY